MQPVLVVLRSEAFRRFMLGVALVLADLIASELKPKKTR